MTPLPATARPAWSEIDLDALAHNVRTIRKLLRPTDIAVSAGNPAKAQRALGWSTQLDMPRVIERMIRPSLT